MKFQTIKRASLIVLTLSGLFRFSADSQETLTTEKEGSLYTLRVYEELVLVDVVVTDKKGNPIRNLRKTDFQILEDNKPQSISTFDFEDLTPVLTTAPTVQTELPKIDLSKPETTPKTKESLRNHRFMVLFIDQSSMPIEDLIQAQKTVQEFIDTQLTPADLVAVVSNGTTLKVLQDFTNDREALKKAAAKLYLGDAASLAEAGSVDAETSGTSSEDTSDSYTADDSQFNVFNTDRKLASIESVAKMVRAVPGKKFLVHFSSGISTTGTENQSQLKATVDALNRSNVSLYAVDARGLVALPPGGDATKGSAGGNANYSGRAIRDQASSFNDSEETLTTLALDTGGKHLFDNNNLGQVFQTVREDSSSYYLLGYHSANLKKDGKFRRIKVTLNLPGVQVKYREGYYAPKSFQQYSQSDRERQLEEAISTESPFSDIPFLVSTNFFRASPTLVFVPVALRFPASAIPFRRQGETNQAAFDFIGQVRNSNGKIENALRDTIRLKLDQQTSRKALAGEIQYNSAFFLKPGEYRLKFLVRENQTGKLGTFEQPLSVPEYGKGSVSMSSLILSNRLLSARGDPAVQRRSFWNLPGMMEDFDPLVVETNRIVPSIARVFSPGDTLYILFQVYVQNGSNRQPDLTALLAFQHQGRLFRNAGTVPLTSFDEHSSDTITRYFQVPLAGFPAGELRLEILVQDPIKGEVLRKSINFFVTSHV